MRVFDRINPVSLFVVGIVAVFGGVFFLAMTGWVVAGRVIEFSGLAVIYLGIYVGLKTR